MTDILRQQIEKYRGQLENESAVNDIGDGSEAFLLVEKSRHDGAIWLTTWATPEAAADYHDGQEYADDWEIVELVDLRTGKTHAPTTTTTFTEGQS